MKSTIVYILLFVATMLVCPWVFEGYSMYLDFVIGYFENP